MHFKINKTGCGVRKGLCEIRYDLYLDEGDVGYDEHYVQVPVIPPEGYTGEIKDGMPVDLNAYNKWFEELPRVWQLNPFCCHFVQFEPAVTDLEILNRGDEVLAMAARNKQAGNLKLNRNPPVQFSSNPTKVLWCQQRMNSIVETDFLDVAVKAKSKAKIRG